MKLRDLGIISLGVFALALTACGGGSGGSTLPSGGGATPTPTPVVTPSVTPAPTLPPIRTQFAQSLNCTTQGASQSFLRQSASSETKLMPRRLAARQGFAKYVPGAIEVTYSRASFAANRAALQSAIRQSNANEASTLDFGSTGRVVQVLHVAPGQEDATIAKLRSNPLVQSVSRSSVRYATSTTASSAFTNDPFFNGITVQTPPLYQNSQSGGQWDVHVICAANAWAYANTNTTGNKYPGAAGGTVPIAIIDTGADLTHPELASHITYSESDLNGVTTVGGVTDNDGHGTNVAGIAAAIGNNAFGFAGVAYNSPLMIFKVFPNGPCTGGCTANASDVGLAIDHAVAKGARVINLSLGATSPDLTEENAVAAAIAAGVVVVAASGNDSSAVLDYPGADPGVIAVGASGLDDSTATITETVASFSNYDAAHPTTWGLVAPGGTAPDKYDEDTLHWIEGLYTSTATDSNAACRADPGAIGPNDCRVLITGTSQATPHVAGAAALLLSVAPSSFTPAQVKSALCGTATQISNPRAGCGRLNVYRAMAQVLGDSNP